MTFKGKVALVTGAGSGIGKAIAAAQEKSAENFRLGETAEDSLSGQLSIDDAATPQPAESGKQTDTVA